MQRAEAREAEKVEVYLCRTQDERTLCHFHLAMTQRSIGNKKMGGACATIIRFETMRWRPPG
jgi:hypothetical protein